MTFTTLANLDLSCVSKITAEIKTGPWTQAQRTAMATSMSNAMTTTPTQATGPRGCQKCIRFDQYLLHDQWTFLKDPMNSRVAKQAAIAQWLFNLGLSCPGIPLLKLATAMLMHAEMEGSSGHAQVKPMTPSEQNEAAKNIQWHVKELDKKMKYPHAHVLVYPEKPCDLPEKMQRHAWGEQQPVEIVIHDLAMVAGRVPYKNTHNAIRQRPGKGQWPSTVDSQQGKGQWPSTVDSQQLSTQTGNQGFNVRDVINTLSAMQGLSPSPNIWYTGAGSSCSASMPPSLRMGGWSGKGWCGKPAMPYGKNVALKAIEDGTVHDDDAADGAAAGGTQVGGKGNHDTGNHDTGNANAKGKHDKGCSKGGKSSSVDDDVGKDDEDAVHDVEKVPIDPLADLENVMLAASKNQALKAKEKAKETKAMKKKQSDAAKALAAVMAAAEGHSTDAQDAGVSMKRPAAAESPTPSPSKKPAIASSAPTAPLGIQFTAMLDKTHPTFAKGRNNFASSVYGRVQTLAKKTMSADEASKLAKAMYSEASAFWAANQ